MWLAGIPIILFYDHGYDPFGKSQEWDHCLWWAAKPRRQGAVSKENQRDIWGATNRLRVASSSRDWEPVADLLHCRRTKQEQTLRLWNRWLGELWTTFTYFPFLSPSVRCVLPVSTEQNQRRTLPCLPRSRFPWLTVSPRYERCWRLFSVCLPGGLGAAAGQDPILVLFSIPSACHTVNSQ